MTGAQSNVGQGNLYVDGDQRVPQRSEQTGRPAYEEFHSAHQNIDSKDNKSIAQKIAAQSRSDDPSTASGPRIQPEAELSKKDPTAPAVLHGHQPSKGAKVDKELREEEQEILHEKGVN